MSKANEELEVVASVEPFSYEEETFHIEPVPNGKLSFSHAMEDDELVLKSDAERVIEHLRAQSVTNIMLRAASKSDGEGEAVYAQSVEDVVAEIDRLKNEVEALRAERDAQAAGTLNPVAPEQEDILVMGYFSSDELGMCRLSIGRIREDSQALMTVAQHERIMAAMVARYQQEKQQSLAPVAENGIGNPEVVAWTNELHIEHLRAVPHTGSGFQAKGREEAHFHVGLVRKSAYDALAEQLRQLRGKLALTKAACKNLLADPDEPLDVQVVGGQLVISIGLDLLLQTIVLKHSWPVNEKGEPLKVIDREQFVQDIILELTREYEDGPTLLHRAFDQAAVNMLAKGTSSVESEKS